MTDPKLGDHVEIEFSIAGMVGVSTLDGKIVALDGGHVEVIASHPKRTIKAPIADLRPRPDAGWLLDVDLGLA